MDSIELLKHIKSKKGIKVHQGDTITYHGRPLYVIQDTSIIGISNPKDTAYDHWLSYDGFKVANSSWLPRSNLPIVKLAVLLNDGDSLKGYTLDLAYGWDNSAYNTNPAAFKAGLKFNSGSIVAVTLESPESIDSLLNQF